MIIRRRRGWKSPFDELDEMRNRMERLARSLSGEGHTRRSAGVYPLLNVGEDKEKYTVRAELPGVSAEDLDISVTGKSLAVSGQRKSDVEESAKYHRREREAGKFSRVIELPDIVDAEAVEARLTDGVLNISLPKSAAAKPRQISVS